MRNSRSTGLFAKRAGRSGQPLHRVHEFLGQAGAEGRRDVSTISRRVCPSALSKTRCTRSSAPVSADDAGASTSSCRAAPSINDAVLRAFELELGRRSHPPEHRRADGRLRRGAAGPSRARAVRRLYRPRALKPRSRYTCQGVAPATAAPTTAG